MAENDIIQAKVTVMDSHGLHLRVASDIARLCHGFSCSIKITNPGKGSADAKSALAVMCLAATQGTELELAAEGPDAQEAISRLVDYFALSAQ